MGDIGEEVAHYEVLPVEPVQPVVHEVLPEAPVASIEPETDPAR